ncbi:hypothetical protein KAH55_03125 [bacterium]|nr:hypothetical protein [bacterium]
MKKTVYLIAVIALVFGCRPDPDAEKKIDPYLKIWIQELTEAERRTEVVSVLFKINDDLTENHYAWFRNNGVEIKAQIDLLCAAQTNVIGIYKLASQRFVIQVAPSKEFIRKMQAKLFQATP